MIVTILVAHTTNIAPTCVDGVLRPSLVLAIMLPIIQSLLHAQFKALVLKALTLQSV